MFFSPPDGHLPHCLGGGAGPALQAGASHHQGPRPCLWEVREDPPAHPAEGEGGYGEWGAGAAWGSCSFWGAGGDPLALSGMHLHPSRVTLHSLH